MTNFTDGCCCRKKDSVRQLRIFPNEEPGSRGFLGLAYGLLGRRAEAEELRKSEPHPNHLALICAGLGDKDWSSKRSTAWQTSKTIASITT
jgi:hypothetical protein